MTTITTAIMGVVNAALSLLLAFGVNVSEGQTAAITTFVNALLILGALIYNIYGTRKPTVPTPPKTS